MPPIEKILDMVFRKNIVFNNTLLLDYKYDWKCDPSYNNRNLGVKTMN